MAREADELRVGAYGSAIVAGVRYGRQGTQRVFRFPKSDAGQFVVGALAGPTRHGSPSRNSGESTRRPRMDTGSCHKECQGPPAFLLM